MSHLTASFEAGISSPPRGGAGELAVAEAPVPAVSSAAPGTAAVPPAAGEMERPTPEALSPPKVRTGAVSWDSADEDADAKQTVKAKKRLGAPARGRALSNRAQSAADEIAATRTKTVFAGASVLAKLMSKKAGGAGGEAGGGPEAAPPADSAAAVRESVMQVTKRPSVAPGRRRRMSTRKKFEE